MAILGFELEEIVQLLTLLESRGLDEIIIEEDDSYLRVRAPRQTKKGRGKAAASRDDLSGEPARQTRLLPPGRPSDFQLAKPGGLAPNEIALESPMMGTFYRAEKPGSPPLVEVGQHVEAGQAIGIIEAMKIFSEVPAEQSGTAVAFPVQDGQLVHAGTLLLILRKDLRVE